MCASKPREALYTHEDVEKEIANGKKLLIFDGKVVDVTQFSKIHPGGELVMEHALHRDATALIRVFHPDRVLEKRIPCFVVGRLDPDSVALQARLHAEKFDPSIDTDFMELYKTIEAKGLFKSNIWFFLSIMARLAIIFAIFVGLVVYGPNTTQNYALAAFVNGVFWHQSAFIGHDTGHGGITQSLYIDNCIGILFGNILGGISMAWWKRSHYVHHVATNHPEHDPDIQHIPVFAVTTKFFNSLYSTYHKRIMHFDSISAILVSIQHFLYYPVMAIGRFNLYLQSFLLLVSKERVLWRPAEIMGLVIFWTWYSTLLSYLPNWGTMVMYVLISNCSTFVLHIQITLSHFAMCTEEFGQEGEPFPAHQLRTTMDVDCPRWMDWFHGGLQFQAIHHLFPRLPRHNLRKVLPLVKAYCAKHGLTYHTHGFAKGNRMVLGAMQDVANHVGLMVSAAKSHSVKSNN
eukprot:CAMPEP_0116866174 /NCGR_PEP_ID=MMETSP0418-20121206/25880_1 /TAXON_ID=1158023 /ORGANISM="Astrosyne radiata, Strain 13vi08-1A" /LENGTH=459 /DNA_ID=CAMNT_0004501775 /DNA_START=190 /DNA_END=1572 /DNA_ORIENTATION=+